MRRNLLIDPLPDGMDVYRRVPTGPLYGGPTYPSNGYPPDPYEDRDPGSAWGRLKKGQNAGKKSVIKYNNALNSIQYGEVPMLQLQGDDMDACSLVLTISPPAVIPIAFDELTIVADQNLTGENTNLESYNPIVGNFPGTDEPVAYPPIQAEIEWGVGGTYQRAIVDAINGATVNLVASFVKARAFIYTPAARAVDGTAAAYVLGAHLGPGWHAAPGAQCTIYVGVAVPNVETATVPVPPFARRAYVYGCDGRAISSPDLASGYLRFWQNKAGSTNGLCVGEVFFTGNQPDAFATVPNGAMYASIINQAANPLLYNIVFELSI